MLIAIHASLDLWHIKPELIKLGRAAVRPRKRHEEWERRRGRELLSLHPQSNICLVHIIWLLQESEDLHFSKCFVFTVHQYKWKESLLFNKPGKQFTKLLVVWVTVQFSCIGSCLNVPKKILIFERLVCIININ